MLTFVIFRKWFIEIDKVIVFGDWHAWSRAKMLDYFSMPYAWETSEICGYYSVAGSPSLSKYPILLLQAIIVHYGGIDFGLVERILYFFPFPFIAVFSMYYLSYVLFQKRTICFFSSLLFISNSHVLWRVASGGLPLAIACALTPLALAFLVRSLDGGKILRDGAVCSLVAAISLFYDLRIGYLLFAVILSYVVFNLLKVSLSKDVSKIKKILTKSVKVVMTLVVIVSSFHAFWVSPAIFARMPTVPSGYTAPASADSLSFSNFSTVLCLSWELWPYPIVWPAVIAITILVFSAATSFLRYHDGKIVYLIVLYLVSAFLAKGTRPPAGDIYTWLFLYFPGFSAFREPLKFLFVASMPYALLFGVAIESLNQLTIRIFNNIRSIEKMYMVRSTLWKNPWSAIALILLLINASPVLTDQVSGTFEPRVLPKHYHTIDKIIERLPQDFRTLWIPGAPSYLTYNREHPAAYVGAFSSDFDHYFLGHVFFQGNTDYSKILGLENIRYIVVSPESEESWKWIPEEQHSLVVRNILKSQRGIERISTGDDYYVYENNFALPHFYAVSHAVLVIGGRDLLLTSAPYVNFSQYAFLFIDQLKSQSLDVLETVNLIVFPEGKNLDDLTVALLPDRFRVNLWQYAKTPLTYMTGKEGYWIKGSSSQNLANILVRKLGEILENPNGPVETYSDARMDFMKNIEETGEYDLWLRVGLSPTMGKLTLLIDGIEAGKLSLITNQTILKWVKLGSYILSKGQHKFSLINQGGQNLLDDLIIVPHNLYAQHKKETYAILEKKSHVYLGSNKDTSCLRGLSSDLQITPVYWKKINPTMYEVTVNITAPTFLIFSESYDPLWIANLNGEELRSIIAYSAFNSFLIKNVGETNITITFIAQQYVYAGTIISVLAAIILTTYFVFTTRHTRKFYLVQRRLTAFAALISRICQNVKPDK